MSWLARLKTSKTPEKDASKTAETVFVVSEAPTLAPLQKFEGAAASANDPSPTPTKAAVLPDEDSGAVIDIGTIRPPGLSAKLLAASMALDAQIQAAGALPGNGPDRWCWPHSTAMTGSAIDLFTARMARFTDKGVTHGDAESLADKLLVRDRDDDDRVLCLECAHLGGYGRTSWRCGNWRAAGIAILPRGTQLPADLVLRLQRCDGFSPHHTSTSQRNDYEHDRH